MTPKAGEVVKPTAMNDNPKPVQDPAFWKMRIYKTLAREGRLHQVIYDDSTELWDHCRRETGGILRRWIPPGASVLDAGCGYGALVESLVLAEITPRRYVGADVSHDLIDLAYFRYVGTIGDDSSMAPQPIPFPVAFQVADLNDLPYPTRAFDWCVARSVEGMVIENCGPDAWAKMLGELRRVAVNVLLIDYAAEVGGPVHAEVWVEGAERAVRG